MWFRSLSFTWETVFYKIFSDCYFVFSIRFRNFLSVSVILLFKCNFLKRAFNSDCFSSDVNFRFSLWMIKRRLGMRIITMNLYLLPMSLFVIAILGVILNQSNIILVLVCIEMMLLSISMNFLTHSFIVNDSIGQLCSIFIITVAAVESAIGLSIMIAFYKLRGSITIRFLNLLKG